MFTYVNAYIFVVVPVSIVVVALVSGTNQRKFLSTIISDECGQQQAGFYSRSSSGSVNFIPTSLKSKQQYE